MKTIDDIMREVVPLLGTSTYLRDIQSKAERIAKRENVFEEDFCWKMLKYIMDRPDTFRVENRKSGRITILK